MVLKLNTKKNKLVTTYMSSFRIGNKDVEIVDSFCFQDQPSTVQEQAVKKYTAEKELQP